MRQCMREWCVEQVPQSLRDGSWQHEGPRGHEGRRDDRPWPQGTVAGTGNAITPKRHDRERTQWYPIVAESWSERSHDP